MVLDRPPSERSAEVSATKSTFVAYLFLLIVGGLGIHKFYLRRHRMGFLYLLLFVLGSATASFGFGIIFLAVLVLLLLYDLFTMPSQVHRANSWKSEETGAFL